LEYFHELTGRIGMDAEQIEGLSQGLYEEPLAELCGGEASGLIRALQELQEGWDRMMSSFGLVPYARDRRAVGRSRGS
jgi:hypothetical protein